MAESDYKESYQISAKEGSLVFHDYVTYGYGDVCDWDDLEKRKTISQIGLLIFATSTQEHLLYK